jgi:membrane protease YdiL (CAAX protease family)
MFRQRLVTLLTFCDKISLITEDLLIRLGIPLLFYHPFCNLYHEQQQSKNKRLSYLACQSFSSLVSTVLVGPIIEEALYRSLFHRTWLTMSKLLIQNNREQKPQEKTTFVKESWVLTNSLLFGIAHISNWMPLDKKYLEDEISIFFRMVARRDVHKHPMRFDKEKNILSSLYQSQHAFILSLICFTPLYQQRGVMASISAHSTMNLLNLCFPNHRYLLAFASALHLLSNL